MREHVPSGYRAFESKPFTRWQVCVIIMPRHRLLERYGLTIPTPARESREAQAWEVPRRLQNNARQALEQIRTDAADPKG